MIRWPQVLSLIAGSIALFMCVAAAAQSAPAQGFGICKPVSQRNGERLGCWILLDAPVGKINEKTVYWHLDAYPDHAAAEKAKTDRGIVLEALGKTWVATMEKKSWRPKSTGKRIAEIGPIPVKPGKQYSATFMETIMNPGVKSNIHTHSGPEAWYTESGEACLETTNGKVVGKPGSTNTIVPEGPSMELTATGHEERRGITLILHDSSQPPTTMVHDWKPKGLCNQSQ